MALLWIVLYKLYSYIILTVRSFSFQPPYKKMCLVIVEKMLVCFRGLIVGLHQANKTTKDVTEMTKIGLKIVQCFFKTWVDIESGKHHL